MKISTIILSVAYLAVFASSRPADKKPEGAQDSPSIPHHLLELYNNLNKEDSGKVEGVNYNTIHYQENVALGRY